MTFSQIEGNAQVKQALAGMINSGKVPHAIMFHENDGGGGVALALAFLQDLYCSHRGESDSCGECPSCNKISKLIHPDVHFVYPVVAKTVSLDYVDKWRKLVLENPSFTESDFNEALDFESKSPIIAVSEAKAMIENLSLSALEGGYRAVLIYLPEKMNQEAANKLLKLIEEPPVQTQFVLVTHAPEKVLSTISSRCQRIRVVPERGGETPRKEYPEFVALMEALLSRDLLASLKLGEDLASLPSREAMKECCAYGVGRLRDIFLIQQGMSALAAASEENVRWAGSVKKTFPRQASEAFDRARMLLDRNVNPKILFADLVNRLYLSL